MPQEAHCAPEAYPLSFHTATSSCCRQETSAIFLAEILFAYSTDGANPIFWKVLESSSGLNAVVGVAHLGVVNPTTSVTYVLHNVKMY